MKKVHFIGIGGAGMAPLAEILLSCGVTVSGSDREANSKTAHLSELGAAVSIGHDAGHLPSDAELVIRTSAAAEDNPEWRRAVELGIPVLRRGEFLAKLADEWPRPVAVSGAHGKTSVTALLAHIFCRAGMEPAFLIGGAVPGSPSSSAGSRERDLFITEVDESDGTHVFIHPALGVVPNVDDDHSWSVGGTAALRENFRKFGEHSRRLIYYGSAVTDEVFAGHPSAVRLELPSQDAVRGRWRGLQLCNALLAVRAAVELGLDEEHAWRLLEDFPGVARRMTLHRDEPRLRVIEDYAHHPAELAASLSMLRQSNAGYHLRVLFQPHRYARLACYLEELARELRRADSVFVAPVFAAWSESGPVGGAELAESAGGRYVTGSWEEIAREVLRYSGKEPLLIAVIGAGDVEKVLPYLKTLPA